jgi:rhamnogalacturonan endolyase
MRCRGHSVMVFLCVLSTLIAPSLARAQFQMENLSRGVIAIRTGANQVYVGWRLFGTDPTGTAFNVYRSSGGGSAVRLNGAPLSSTTDFIDSSSPSNQSMAYHVRPVVNGVEQSPSASFTLPANAPVRQYLEFPLQVPPGGTTPTGESYSYTANDLSVGDLDGDGEFEYVLKWDPTNSKDNSQAGYTGNVFLDAYELSGVRLWRIDLGRNIRAGAHYTQFMVYDLDGDGRAEVAAKTSDATRSGTGQVIGNAGADHRNSSGYVLTGPEFLTVFDGRTGGILATTDYVPARGTVSSWGDSYGNRVDRFLAGIAYLDGQKPSLVMARGYYTRTVIAAWDWRNGQLTRRWVFDAASGTPYAGQGDHSLSIADVDADGRHEIVYGAMVVDDNGVGKHTTGHGHGDALHVSDFDPNRSGLEIFTIQERVDSEGAYLRNADNGQVFWTKPTTSGDEGPGRGMAADIDPRHRGAEYWVAGGGISGIFNNAGAVITTAAPPSCNFAVWWDADPLRELLNNNVIDKWNAASSSSSRLLTAAGVTSNNGTKSNPALSGDLFGDWREEVVWRASDSSSLRIYTTTVPATSRFFTFLHDPQYRVALAWQNVAYNQPPHPGFYVGDGMAQPPRPNIVLVGGGTTNPPPPASTYQAESMPLGGGTTTESINGGFLGSGYVNFSLSGGSLDFTGVDGGSGGSRALRIRYALGTTASRAGRLVVNGASQAVSFAPTGAWTTWSLLIIAVDLRAGTSNTVRFESNGQDLANIDQIEIQ